MDALIHLRRSVLPAVAAGALAGCGLASDAPADSGAARVRAVDPFAQRPDFFPLGVYLQSPQLAEQWRAVGVNMIAPVNGHLTLDTLSRLAALGMVAGGKASDALPLDLAGETLAFLVAEDEPDNAQPAKDGSYGPCRSHGELDAEATHLRKVGGGRPILRNFGRGLADPAWPGRGKCTGQEDSYYPAAIASADIVSFDDYPVAHGAPLEEVAQGARRLRGYVEQAGGGQVQWGIIEVSAIFGGRQPSPEEIRSMAWMHIINGARGLVFFPWQVGEKGERIREDALFQSPSAVEGLTALTAEISGLSPVIKAGRVAAALVECDRPHSAMARVYRGDAYVFIVNESPQPAEVTFGVKDFAGGTISVVGGAQGAPEASGGRFADRLAGYEAKIYRISGTRT